MNKCNREDKDRPGGYTMEVKSGSHRASPSSINPINLEMKERERKRRKGKPNTSFSCVHTRTYTRNTHTSTGTERQGYECVPIDAQPSGLKHAIPVIQE